MSGNPEGDSDISTSCAIMLEEVCKSFGTEPALSNVSFDVKYGEVLAVIGPSGCGKTTLLRCIIGLEEVDAGAISVLGFSVAGKRLTLGSNYNSLDALRADVGIVFQHLYLWPLKTVRQNIIEAPVLIRKMEVTEANQLCEELLAQVGLEGKASFYPHMLSGGEQQRVALARALAMTPRILLLDEITSALDPERASGILELVKNLVASRGLTSIVVTHEMRFAREISQRVLFLDQGAILENRPTQEFFLEPRHERSCRFLKRVLGA